MRAQPLRFTQSIRLLILIPALVVLALSSCAPKALAPVPTQTSALAAATQAPSATVQPSRTATPVPTASASATASPPAPVLPAPLYFLSPQDGVQQVWRVEMNAGFAHPITAQPAGVTGYDINPVDGRLVFISDNDLYLCEADGSHAQMIVDGEPIQTGQPNSQDLRISEPIWSPDGKEIAFARNGLNVISLPSMYVRNLIANVPLDQNDWGSRRFYAPLFWSPDGVYIATQIGYFEGAELGIIPAAGGELMDAHLPTCCATRSANEAAFYLGAVNGMDQGGLWQVQWSSARAAQLSPVIASNQYPPIYGYPQYGLDGRLYYLFGSDMAPQIVRSDPLNLSDKEVVGQLTYLPPGQALWAPDASVLILPGKKADEPMQLWQMGKEPVPLAAPGSNFKWGVATTADQALAQTPAPTFTPTPTLPALPASSELITRANVTRLRALTTISGKNDVYSLAVSPDGRLLALGLESGVELWDLSTMQRTARLGPYGGIVPALAFSPDSRSLAVGSWDRNLDLWDTASGEKVRPFTGHTDWVAKVDFSPDGKLLASVGNDNKLFVWDAASGAPLRMVDLGHWASDVSFSPDGKLLAVTGWDTATTIYQLDDWSTYAIIPYQPDRYVLNLKFSPDGRTLALGTWDYRVVLWDVEMKAARNEMHGHTDNPTGLTFSPDGSLLASAAEGGEMRIWDAVTGGQLHELPGDRNAAFSPDGRFLFAGGPNIVGVVVYYVP